MIKESFKKKKKVTKRIHIYHAQNKSQIIESELMKSLDIHKSTRVSYFLLFPVISLRFVVHKRLTALPAFFMTPLASLSHITQIRAEAHGRTLGRGGIQDNNNQTLTKRKSYLLR